MTRPIGSLALSLLLLCGCAGSGARDQGAGSVATVNGSEAVGEPSGLAVGRQGDVFVADGKGNKVVRIDRQGHVVAVAGTGQVGFAGDGGPAIAAELSEPAGLAFDSRGNLYVADRQNSRVRRIDRSGVITTVAGDGRRGFTGDGVAATTTALNAPTGVAVAGDGSLIIADTDNRRVRRVDPHGVIGTIAGGGVRPIVDGPQSATAADVAAPSSVAVSRGDVYVALPGANMVVRVSTSGTLVPIAGSRPGHDVEEYDGPATDALLHGPADLAGDQAGNLYVSEVEADRVRRIDGKGTIRTVALKTGFDHPGPIAVGANGALYVADLGHHVVRWVSRAATHGSAVLPDPAISSVQPVQGGAGGGTFIRIEGKGFSALTTTVTFGKAKAQILHATASEVVVATPPHAAGDVDVTVRTRSGASRSGPATRYTYVNGWQLGPALSTPRYHHTATLLDPPACGSTPPPAGYPCGAVLVAGGTQDFCFGCPALASAELYDPATGAWRATGSMTVGRMEHTATLLVDGRVLVAGGRRPNTDPYFPNSHITLDSAEIYDPVTGTWSPAANMAAARLGATATLLGGPGCQGGAVAAYCGRVLMVGGSLRDAAGPGDSPRPAEVYDPVRGAWTLAANLVDAPSNHTATALPDGRVLIAGGVGPFGRVSAASFLYDPAADAWSPTAGGMAIARYAHTATLLHNGQVLLVGGATSPLQYVQSAELFDPSTGRWKPTGAPLAARAGHVAALLPDGRVLAAGGGPPMFDVYATAAGNGAVTHDRPDSIASAEIYDPSTNAWSETRPLNVARSTAAAVVLDGPTCHRAAASPRCGEVLIVGGGGTNYDLAPDAGLTPVGPMEVYR